MADTGVCFVGELQRLLKETLFDLKTGSAISSS